MQPVRTEAVDMIDASHDHTEPAIVVTRGEITAEAVRFMQDLADLGCDPDGEWVVIEGYDL